MLVSRLMEEVFMDLTLDQLIQCHEYHLEYLSYWQNTPFHGVVRELFWMNCVLVGWLDGQWTRPQFCYKFMLLKEIFCVVTMTMLMVSSVVLFVFSNIF